MKKILMILCVGLFLIGCQSNDSPEDEQVELDNGEEQVDDTDDVEETDEKDQNDPEDEILPETDDESDETPEEDETDDQQNDSEAGSYSSDEAKSPNPYKLDGTRANKQQWMQEYGESVKKSDATITQAQKDAEARAKEIEEAGKDLGEDIEALGEVSKNKSQSM